jgi:glycosyltransferase involved in cell wall biosynthesis
VSTNYWPRVAVPARNEAGRLHTLLRSLAGQSWQRLSGSALPVIVVLNNCDDGSRALLDELVPVFPSLDLSVVDVQFEPHEAHVGSARRLALEIACNGALDLSHTVLLTTDADALPDPHWVAANLAAIEAGADVVGGEIIGDREEEERLGAGFQARVALHKTYMYLADRLADLIDPLPWDPSPRHSDHSGASIAVRASAYRAVGGMRPIPVREDIDLVDRLRAAGARLRHDPAVRVTVSARLVGRAANGMADCIRGWLKEEVDGRPHLVEDPLAIEDRLYRRRAIRTANLVDEAARELLARRLGIAPRQLLSVHGGPLGRQLLIRRLAGDELDAPATVPVHLAIPLITQRISALEGAVHAA